MYETNFLEEIARQSVFVSRLPCYILSLFVHRKQYS